MRSIILTFLLATIQLSVYSQTPEDTKSFSWRNIGPANPGGRVVDVEALPNDFTKVWIATASGGVWHSENAGITWEPIFDNYETASIGDIAIQAANPLEIWVGTGEANNRNSTSWGHGIYVSRDGGKTFQNQGLEQTGHIARVVLNPRNPNEICACASGHLWGYSGERGLFISRDGGKSWSKPEKGLPEDGKTGCTDLVRDPDNPNILYAAMYHRLRQPWTFYSGGIQGGIYKSIDNGKSWQKLTAGLPGGETGRIGLAIAQSNPRILMALIEARASNSLDQPGSGLYRSEDGGKSWKYVNTYNNRPFYYSQVRINPVDPQIVYLLTTRFMVSTDGGKTLENGSADQEIHGDFHAMWLDPQDGNRYYMGADKGVSLTQDGGLHFQLFDNLPIAQYYRIGYDMRDPYYVYGGLQDNGFYGTATFTRDARGILNDSNWKLHWGDGQYAAVDPDDWTTAFTSAENGGYSRYDIPTHRQHYIKPTHRNIINPQAYGLQGQTDQLRFNWSAPLILSPHPDKKLYAGANHLLESVDQGNSWRLISPDLSTNDPEKTREDASGGVTPDNTGAETHCSITTISISPIDESVIWVGTDDGNVQITRNGGISWQNLRTNVPGVPAGLWVSRLEASHFQPGRAYLSFDGHRSDDFHPWIFSTDDYGKTWVSLTSSMPRNEVVRVIREDLANPDLLFAGTETGIWYSLDRGSTWARFMENFPTVSVYDLAIHERDRDLIAATHGRSLWIADDLSPLEQMTAAVRTSPAYLFVQSPATLWENTSRGGQRGHFLFAGTNPPEIENTSSLPRAEFTCYPTINYYIGDVAEEVKISLTVADWSGHLHQIPVDRNPGIHRYRWNREFDAAPYTEAERKAVEAVWQDYLSEYPSAANQSRYRRFVQAKDDDTRRHQLHELQSAYDPMPVEDEYAITVAGPGTYVLTLQVGEQVQQQTLVIRPDPMLEGKD
ncbi:MAG: hypothetical protein KDC57_11230 [Saprospiraceae bacterium]|nr:hypothetical protein [Saprospiraceae bacterium]